MLTRLAATILGREAIEYISTGARTRAAVIAGTADGAAHRRVITLDRR